MKGLEKGGRGRCRGKEKVSEKKSGEKYRGKWEGWGRSKAKERGKRPVRENGAGGSGQGAGGT